MQTAAQTLSLASNPFMMLLNPALVIDAMNRSEKLEGLTRRVCYPLDRVSTPAPSAEAADAVAGDGASGSALA